MLKDVGSSNSLITLLRKRTSTIIKIKVMKNCDYHLPLHSVIQKSAALELFVFNDIILLSHFFKKLK